MISVTVNTVSNTKTTVTLLHMSSVAALEVRLSVLKLAQER